MVGGLDLATPPIAMPPGKAIAAINYEPDVAGYTSFGGYERFDGQPRPSDATDAALVSGRRAASFSAVPGIGPVRGVWVFDGDVYAFRDQGDGSGWHVPCHTRRLEPMAFGSMLQFTSGTVDFSLANMSLARLRARRASSTG